MRRSSVEPSENEVTAARSTESELAGDAVEANTAQDEAE